MALRPAFEHRFVQFVPDTPDEGIPYISIEFATAVHKCACGCGEEVVTPLSPTQWRLTFDGEAVSLFPSVGSWSLPCQSHYFIERNRVLPMRPWSSREIAAGRSRSAALRDAYYRGSSIEDLEDLEEIAAPQTDEDDE